MRSKSNLTPVFFFTFLLILFLFSLFLLSTFQPVRGFFEQLFVPMQRTVYMSFGKLFQTKPKNEIVTLQEENKRLLSQLIAQQTLEKEIAALRDQFNTTFPSSRELIPASIIGGRVLLPGISIQETVIINKGSKDGMREGYSVVVGDNLLGKITKTAAHVSQVTLLTAQTMTFAGKTLEGETLGVVKGEGGKIVFANVLPSVTLKTGYVIVTKGDIDAKGNGYPPDLIVGKIASVHKKSSALFQSAEIKSLVDISTLSVVFVLPSSL